MWQFPDPNGMEGLKNSGSGIFKEIWRYAQEACLKGCILWGNCLFLDTCRGPAPEIDVIQCLVVVYPGNVGKRNFPKTSSCFSFPFPFFLDFCKTCDVQWLTSWWNGKFWQEFSRALLISVSLVLDLTISITFQNINSYLSLTLGDHRGVQNNPAATVQLWPYIWPGDITYKDIDTPRYSKRWSKQGSQL